MTRHSRHTANAFASTFYFFADTQINAKKIKRACKPTHGGQCKLDTSDLRPEKTTTHNTGLAKVAVQCSADTFVVNQSLVLRINICGENRHLRQARNRWLSWLTEISEMYILNNRCSLTISCNKILR